MKLIRLAQSTWNLGIEVIGVKDHAKYGITMLEKQVELINKILDILNTSSDKSPINTNWAGE